MEVFIAYRRDSDPVSLLEATLNAWNIDGLEPVALELRAKKFEIMRRVTAEKVSSGDYILADLGYEPLEDNFADIAAKELLDHPDAGIFGTIPTKGSILLYAGLPHNVVICRRNVITHWPTARTESYIHEHVEAYQFAGYKAFLCQTIHCSPIAVSSPS